MPSKKYNGNSPLGGSRIEGFADVELEVAKRSPKQSLTTGLVQTHNGAIHAPKRRRRTSSRGSGFPHPWPITDTSYIDDNGDWIPTITVTTHSFDDYTTAPPSLGTGLTGSGIFVGSQNDEPDSGYLIISPTIVTDEETNITTLEWPFSGFGIISAEEYEALESTLDVPIVVIGSYSVNQGLQVLSIRQFVYTRVGLRIGCWNGLAAPILMPI